jgi:hypothetical protein
MSAKLYNWLINPERNVLADIHTSKNGSVQFHIVSWNTDSGRIEARGDSLDAAIRKAYEIDQNPNPEERRRLTYTPTANIYQSAWSTGCRNGKWGWYGYFKIEAELDAEKIEFEVPKLPKGWKYNEFGSNIRRAKHNKRVAYIDQYGKELWRFRFEVLAETKEIWNDSEQAVFNVLCKSLGEVERAHLIIE